MNNEKINSSLAVTAKDKTICDPWPRGSVSSLTISEYNPKVSSKYKMPKLSACKLIDKVSLRSQPHVIITEDESTSCNKISFWGVAVLSSFFLIRG
jgi:hypothetical protein